LAFSYTHVSNPTGPRNKAMDLSGDCTAASLVALVEELSSNSPLPHRPVDLLDVFAVAEATYMQPFTKEAVSFLEQLLVYFESNVKCLTCFPLALYSALFPSSYLLLGASGAGSSQTSSVQPSIPPYQNQPSL
jgi:hypothetical protein